MAEKATTKRRSSRRALAEAVAEAEQTVAEREEADARPEERAAAKVAGEAVAAADALSSEDVVRSIGELKSTITRTLTQLADRLEEEVGKYGHIRRAIAAKETELKEIYEIQRTASTLQGMIETHQRKQEEMERAFQTEKADLDREIETTRTQWEIERQQHDQEVKERDTAEQKRRQRELDEYKYGFARQQQVARDQANDESAKVQKELADRKAESERQWVEREKSIAQREQELTSREQELVELRARVAGFAKDLQAAIDQAEARAAERIEKQHQAVQELLRRELEGEKNVLAARIAGLERTVKEQAEQVTRLEQQAEKAYAQIQEIAVRAIEGSASTKQLANLQQLLAEQVRKPASPER
jgi:colicin import membrane protein